MRVACTVFAPCYQSIWYSRTPPAADIQGVTRLKTRNVLPFGHLIIYSESFPLS